jgi:EmrB/QacA subfamily drug resistance transporter
VVRAGRPAAPCARTDAPWILAATILASSMVFIDGTVANVALPTLQRELNATVYDVQWVIESFALFLAALLLAGGAAGDQFGRRRVFVIGVAIFTLASVWCGVAGRIDELIVARAAQGIGGALLVPGSLAIISASFVESERGKAIGTWSGYSAIAAAVGPVLGGFIIDHLSWRYAFLINLPFGVAVLALAYWRVPESRDERARKLDIGGAVLATVGLGGIVYALIESSAKGWTDARVVTALALGVVALVAFVIAELRHRTPMLPFDLFRSRIFLGANALTLLLYAALGGSLFFFPLNLIQVQGYSATQAGAALLPFVLCMFFLSRWAGSLVDRYGSRLPLVVGPSIAGAGFLLFAVPGIGGSYWTTFFIAALVLGFGMTISVAPLTTTVMNAVQANAAGAASGVNNAVSRVAALLAIALLGIVMARVFDHTLDSALQVSSLPAELIAAIDAQRERLAAIEVPADAAPAARAAAEQAVAAAFVSGFRWVMAMGGLLAFASAGIAFATIRSSSRTAQSDPSTL